MESLHGMEICGIPMEILSINDLRGICGVMSTRLIEECI